MQPLRVFVYEHFSGGGVAGGKIPLDTLAEGYGMLRSLISDFKRAGHEVVTFLDERIWKLDPLLEADDVIPIKSSNELKKKMEEASRSSDFTYVIAPEAGGILRDLVNLVEEAGGRSLNCRPDAIDEVSKKSNIYERLRKVGVKVPETVEVDFRSGVESFKRVARDLGFPLIFKPVCGVGCSGMSLVKNEDEIKSAVEKIRIEGGGSFLIQNFVKGIDTSISAICSERETLPLTLNFQMVTLSSPSLTSRYYGGIVPLHHPMEREAFEIAKKAIGVFKGLRGYVGVDIVLTDGGPLVMEINPRLTTSYIGLRRVIDLNPAQAIVDAVMESKIPKRAEASGTACFFKVEVPAPSIEDLRATYGWESMISPPFPVEGESSWVLLAIGGRQ